MDNWQGQFSQGFNASASLGPGAGLALWIFLIVGGLALGAWYLAEQYRKAQRSGRVGRRSPGKAQAPGSRHPYAAVPGRFNPLQQKVLQDLIDEFRKNEPVAQAVPSAILEKFTEFLYPRIDTMKTKIKDVEEFVDRNYPIREGDGVELDFHSAGSLHLIKSRVLEVSLKTLVVEFTGILPEFLRKGTPVQLNYTVGKHFLQGSSVIVDARQDLGLVLRRPGQVSLTSERRYSRVALKRAEGTLTDARTGASMPVKVLDLSFEGVRVQVGRPLDKSHIYRLVFEEGNDLRKWSFGPIECAPSQAFLTGTGTYETGLLFLYLDVSTRTKVVAFMKLLAQEIQATKPIPPGQEQ